MASNERVWLCDQHLRLPNLRAMLLRQCGGGRDTWSKVRGEEDTRFLPGREKNAARRDRKDIERVRPRVSTDEHPSPS